MREILKPHIGHHIVCVCYRDPNGHPDAEPFDICIKCEDCNEVLISAEAFEEEDTEDA